MVPSLPKLSIRKLYAHVVARIIFSQEYLRGVGGRGEAEGGDPKVFSGWVRTKGTQRAELCRHVLGGLGSLQRAPHVVCRGSRPDGEKRQRNHHRYKLVKADTLTEAQTHGCRGYQAKYPNPAEAGVRTRSLRLGSWAGGHKGRGNCPSRDVALGLGPPGAYRIEEHTARAGRADRESGAGGARNIHGAAAVPGGAWAGLLRFCGAAAGGGSFERGGSHTPRTVALRTATARDPGHRHLN